MFKKLLIHKSDHGIVQLFRYGLVVVVAAPIDLGGYILLKSQLHVYYVLAATISFTISLVVNYILSIKWVWTNHTAKQRHKDAALFTLIGLVGLVITDIVIWICTGLGHLNYIASKLVAFLVVFFWSFFSRRYLYHTFMPRITSRQSGI